LAIATESSLDEALAIHYVADLLHRSLLEAGEPVKASEAAKLAERPEVDLRLARVILATHPNRFTSTDRKWTLWTRFADPDRAVERNLQEIMETYGLPASQTALSRELSAIYDRSPEYFDRLLPRLLADSSRYFSAGDGFYGLRRWLLDVQGETEEDILFDNYLKRPDVAKYEKQAAKLKADKLDSVVAFLDTVNEPLDNKVLQFFAWRSDPDRFDPEAFFTALWRSGQAAYLSGGQWVGPKAVGRLTGFFPAIAEREVDEHGDNTVVETAQPLVISDEEREQIVKTVLKNERASHATELLETIFEVSPGESTYAGDLQTVVDALRSDDRILWVGADRFLPQGAIPQYVFSVPEILHIPVTHYTDAEGNELDFLLEDDGFDGGLQREVLSQLAQDVLDEEPAYTPDAEPPATARCVLKFHHKEIGTFPLSQLAPGFFPIDAPILQVDLTLPTGQKSELWVNNDTRLVYGLLDWYQSLPVDSGAVFYLERQAADRYVLTYGEETEPTMFISRNRVNELIELGRRADTEELPTFDILREIMEHYRKGIEYITLLTEANIARRTTRRMVASLLSGYHCYFQRGGAWVFDAKKLSQGFDKSKRKYLKK
jgi:hypothetical protein